MYDTGCEIFNLSFKIFMLVHIVDPQRNLLGRQYLSALNYYKILNCFKLIENNDYK